MIIYQHPFAYYQGSAAYIDAENKKATSYVRHGPSIGTARERILKRVIRENTPDSLSIESGFVHWSDRAGNTFRVSQQCDLLVYDSQWMPVKYRIDDLVVVDRWATRLAVEIKSRLDKTRFGQAIQVNRSLMPLRTSLLCFAFDSVRFDTLTGYFQPYLDGIPAAIPIIMAVHAKNYFYIRGTSCDADAAYSLYCLRFPIRRRGLATAYFLSWYRQLLTDMTWLAQRYVNEWFDLVGQDPAVEGRVLQFVDVPNPDVDGEGNVPQGEI